MVIKRTRFVLVIVAVALTSTIGGLCLLKIIAVRDAVEMILAACLHNGVVAVFHGLVTKEEE